MLNSLEIKNFRALEDFRVEKLGRVNLIVGKNNSGKSTVLEALRIYAANGNPLLLQEIAKSHDEPCLQEDFFKLTAVPFRDFFSHRTMPKKVKDQVKIGEIDAKNYLTIELGVIDHQANKTLDFPPEGTSTNQLGLLVQQGGDVMYKLENIALTQPAHLVVVDLLTPSLNKKINYSHLPTSILPNSRLAEKWDEISLTENEVIVQRSFRIINQEFQSISFVRDNSSPDPAARFAKVKLQSSPDPIPLKSLGEGMSRILQLALHFPAAKGGFLLIDEFENGLHYSVQEKVWALVFEMAQQLDIQVFATTHSWDCIQSFAKVARERQDVEGILFRVGRSVRKKDEGKIIATVFDEEELYSITQNSIEVR